VSVTWGGDQGRAFAHGQYRTDYYVLEVASDGPPAFGAIGLRYSSPDRFYDLSRTMMVPFETGITRVFFPVYTIHPAYRDDTRSFVGLEVGEDLRARLRGLFRVTRLDDKPLLLDVHLAPGWSHERLFQRSRDWDLSSATGLRAYAALRPGSTSARGWIEMRASGAPRVEALEATWSDPGMVKIDGRRMQVNGRARAQFHYLALFKPVALTEGTLLVARGRLERGGLILGVLENDAWHNQVKVDRPGDFVAAVEVGKTGTFTPLVTNALEGGWNLQNRFVITDLDVMDASGPR
jgi:hypothetical protein